MGLLDDAIREHLDLKRRHGADPSEVARQEQEALGPVGRAEPAEPAGVPDPPEASEAVAPTAGADVADPPAPPPPAGPAESAGAVSLDRLHEDEVAWDAPAREAAPDPDVVPADEDPGDDDVLEQTPDFLEETPEHDRLWFEQRPPRDFDFDG